MLERMIDHIGKLTYFNTWGPISTLSITGSKYYILYIGSKSHPSTIKMCTKALDHFKKYQATVEHQMG